MGDGIRVGVVDQYFFFRLGVILALQAAPNMVLAGEGENADDALRMAKQADIDILLLDLGMSGNGTETLRKLRQAEFKGKIVVLTASGEEGLVIEALRAGVQGYIRKDISGAALVQALQSVHRGEPFASSYKLN